jgi:hypothetical protein
MVQKKLTRLAALSCLLFSFACASDDGVNDEGPPTTEEAQAGAAWDDADGNEPDENTDEGIAVVPGAPEPAAKYLEADPALPDDVTPAEAKDIAKDDIEVNTMDVLKTCRKATGYRRGKAFSICVTTVDGKLLEVNTARAYLRMRTAARRGGASLRVVSGFRTMAQQRYLYRLYKQGRGNLAAPPGYSNHQSGHALDLNTSAPRVYSWLTRYGRRYGFRRTVPSEKWHWEK